MFYRIFLTILLLGSSGQLQAENSQIPEDVILLWDSSTSVDLDSMGTAVKDRGDGELRITNVSVPSLRHFAVKPSAGGIAPAVILCPGGGYNILGITKMNQMAEWLNSLGIHAFVLKYRTPKKRELAFKDIQKAMYLVRSRAEEWGVDSKKIGVLGASAGGNLAARACCGMDQSSDEVGDLIPDFSILLYPAYMIEGHLSEGTELHHYFAPSQDMGPTFIVTALNDEKHFQGSFVYTKALRDSGASVRSHFFEEGGHGFGLRPAYVPLTVWPDLCAQWLRDQSIIKSD